MIKKYMVFILAIFIFWTILSFAQEVAEFTQGEKNLGITQMKAAVDKLRSDMTIDEAEKILGELAIKDKRRYVYLFEGGKKLELRPLYSTSSLDNHSVETTWMRAFNKYGLDLLKTHYYSAIFDFPVFIDGKELLILNQILACYSDYSDFSSIYFSAQDIENTFDTKISWDKENQRLKDISEYAAEAIDFPVFMDDKELITSNPIIFFNDTVYLHMEEISEYFKTETQYNRHNNQKPTNLFDSEYTALVVDYPMFIDGKEFLTFNPIVSIDGKIYFSADEVEENFGIKVYYHEKNRLLEIKTGVKDGFNATKNYDALREFKEGIAKLRDGTKIDGGIKSVLGERYEDHFFDMLTSSVAPIRYRHKDFGVFQYYFSKYISNEYGINVLSTEHTAMTVNFPAFTDGEEIVISSPIVTIGSRANVYLPIEDLAEPFKIKVNFNKDKEKLEITTK